MSARRAHSAGRSLARLSWLSLLAAVAAEPAAGPAATVDALSAADLRVYLGDAEAEAAAFATIGDEELRDHEGAAAAPGPLRDRCQRALKQSVWRERAGRLPPRLHADPLEGVRLGERAKPDDPRIVYFIGVSRTTSPIMVSRLLLALYHHSHLFLIHVDLKTDASVVGELGRLTAQHPNIHVMGPRRLVQWGAWSMVLTMLDALHSLEAAAIGYDFVINLSDVDLALRTNEEVVGFLKAHRGRNFVTVHGGTSEWLEKARNFTSRHVSVECDGHGHVAINSTAPIDLGTGPICCFGRGGPVLYADAAAPAMAEALQAQRDDDAALAGAAGGVRLHTGSQWVVLSADFGRYPRPPRPMRQLAHSPTPTSPRVAGTS